MLWNELRVDLPLAVRWVSVFFWVVALALIPFVLVRRKEPSATIAWILTLVFIPAVGAILFLLFGRDRIRLPAKRKRERDAVVRAQVAASLEEAPERDSSLTTPESPLERALFRVGARLTHLRATSGNLVEVLTEGAAMYDALGASIDAARNHVHAQYYLDRKSVV